MNNHTVRLHVVILALIIIGTAIFTHLVTRKLTITEVSKDWQEYYDAPEYSYSKEVGRWTYQVVKVLDNDGSTGEGFQEVIIKLPGDRLEIVTIPATTTTPQFVESIATRKDNKDILVAVRAK